MYRLFLIGTIFLLTYFAKAQSYEFAICGGLSNYSGDLTDGLGGSISQSHPGFGAYLRYDFSNMFSTKLQFLNLEVSGMDSKAKADWQRTRDLHFKSKVQELAILAQINLKGFITEFPGRWNPYISFGFAFFKFNPKALYNGSWIELQTLGTEGQGLPNYHLKYKRTNLGLTAGFGLRYFISPKFSSSLEFLTRQTLTDYLDDASTHYVDYDILRTMSGQAAADLGNKIKAADGSQRANQVDKDWYSSLMISFAYHIGKDFGYKEFRFRKKPVNCPKF